LAGYPTSQINEYQADGNTRARNQLLSEGKFRSFDINLFSCIPKFFQMKTLDSLIRQIHPLQIIGATNVTVSQLTQDSRQVGAGTLFAALPGTQTDGHSYIPKALALGASVILCEELPAELPAGVTFVKVSDAAEALGWIANAFYDEPSRKLSLVGITGTNGKTTTVTLLFKLFRGLGYRCGLLSTVQNQIDDEVLVSTHTTPDAIAFNALLARMVAAGCTHVFAEVSSHAVVQHRVTGLHFRGGIFSNITHDHLDFHKTFDQYIRAKKGFFDGLTSSAFALVNVDDPRGKVMVQNTKAKVATYSLETVANFHGRIVSDGLYGLQMEIEGREVHFQLIGTFNAYNLMAILGAALLLGEDLDNVLAELSGLTSAPGRFEQIVSPLRQVGIVDYAHTPDALQNVLRTINQIKDEPQRVITVVGCGGNRDATKRPIMTKIACELSSQVILTSDNPRNEDPLDILNDMQKGIPPTHYRRVEVIPDRAEAIQSACRAAQPGDIVLVAGKGHETYQEIKGIKYDFDDREVIRQCFGL
jgi:UDP-N-acetylmuramoyl-L-alanyl-D-glutamate--2,6-diaminopimelate ligase